jgi:hypothetical protein
VGFSADCYNGILKRDSVIFWERVPGKHWREGKMGVSDLFGMGGSFGGGRGRGRRFGRGRFGRRRFGRRFGRFNRCFCGCDP